MSSGLVDQLQEVKPNEASAPLDLPHRDVRAKRPHGLSQVVRMRTLRRIVRVTALAALDAAGIFLAILTALEFKRIVQGSSDLSASFEQAQEFAPLAILVTFLLFMNAGLYADRAARPGFSKVIAALFQVTIVALAFAVVEGGEEFRTYYVFYGTLAFALVYVSGFRYLFERVSGWALRAAGYRRRAVLVGSGAHIEAVAHALKVGASEVEPVGFVSLTPLPSNGIEDLGSLEALEERREEIDEVLIADPDFPQEQAVELVDWCHRYDIRVRVAPSTMEILMDRVEFVPGQTLPLFELKPPVFEGIDFAVKRTFDLVGALLLLLVLSPLLALCALAIKLTSRGPVIYRSPRPGIGGKSFDCLKFRTMYVDADARQPDLEHRNEQEGALFKIRDDPRVTPVGRLLRRWSIDELAQLVNVLRGQMSLVGPRPLPLRDYAKLADWHRKRYLVLPGMTGLWQVSGRAELDFDELVRLDFLYLERWSVFLDLTILLRTIPAVIRAHGAW